MDGEQIKARYSIQRDLSRWIMLTSLVLVLIAGIVSATIAFFEARELQDNMLKEIGTLVNANQLEGISSRRNLHIEEESIIIQFLGNQTNLGQLEIPVDIANGFHTIRLAGEKWRLLVLTQKISSQRVAIAQQTELRDNIAWASSMNVVLPVLILVFLMLILIHFIVRNRLQPLKSLTSRLDQQVVTHLTPLPVTNIPEEIEPFITSINALMARTRQVMQKQHRFIADAAHELRTPITALSLLSENLGRASSKTERLERHAMLQQGLDRIKTLAIQLLDLARLQSDTGSQMAEVSFNRLVMDVIADLHPLAEAAKVDLGVTRQEPVTVMDDDGRLGQLVRNAIDNAIRYSSSGSKVDVSIYAEGENVVFCVKDSGVGIPEKELHLVKEPFYRTLATTQTGNGLGLAICQEIAQLLGGTITLSNRAEGGLRFLYTQPRVLIAITER